MSIAAAIFSESQSRLFRWVFGQPERTFHLSELRRLTGLGSASLQRELRRLSDAGLVCSERVGNLRQFHANRDSPVFNELVALAKKTLTIQPMLYAALSPLQPHLKAAWVYGSIAKKTEKAGSDIDVMLVAKNLPLSKILECLLPLEAELGRKINPTCYTLTEFQKRRAEADSFVNRVLAQPIEPLIGNVNELTGAR